ncbi:MAG: hypothetical protein M3Q65_09690 [Chloroflexota bacterium]|nr:hypothetical protein [Chloroflexota bacterium]
MSDPFPLDAPLAVPFLLALVVALGLGLVEWLVRSLRAIQHASRPLHAHLARLAARFRASAGVAPVPTVGDAVVTVKIAIRVLIEDRSQRERVRRHVGAVLEGCVAAMGAPAGPCTVMIVQGLEREGKPTRGCVERLSFPDGTIRTIASLPLREGSRALSLDEIAARLVRYYPEVTGAERTVVLADDMPTTLIPAAASPAPSMPPSSPSLVSLPAGTGAGATLAETLNGRVGRH